MPIPFDIMEVKLKEWCCGDNDAAVFLGHMMAVIRLADNIVDGDSKAPVPDMAQLLQRAFVFVPSNPFFQRHLPTLSTVWSMAVNQWQRSEDALTHDDERAHLFAFVRREDVENLTYAVATICGGPEHARRVMDDMFALCHVGRETYAEWRAEHGLSER